MRTIYTLIAAVTVLFSVNAAHAEPAYQKVKELTDIYGQVQNKTLSEAQGFEKIYESKFCQMMSFVPQYRMQVVNLLKLPLDNPDRQVLDMALLRVKIDFAKVTGATPGNMEFENEFMAATEFCALAARNYLAFKK